METDNNNIFHAQTSRLTIRIGEQRMIFAVGNPQGLQKIVYETYETDKGLSAVANFRNAISSSELLGSGYKRCLALLTTDVMLIPIDEFQNEDTDLLYQTSFSGHEKDELVHSILPNLKVAAVFPVNKDLKKALCEHFEEVQFLPSCQPVWTHLYRRNFTVSRQKLFAYFYDKRMNIFCFAQNRFKFCNTFDATHMEDALYFLFYTWKQLGFHAEKDELYLVGNFQNKEQIREQLKLYIQRFSFINPAVEFDHTAIAVDEHLPYDLKALYLDH